MRKYYDGKKPVSTGNLHGILAICAVHIRFGYFFCPRREKLACVAEGMGKWNGWVVCGTA